MRGSALSHNKPSVPLQSQVFMSVSPTSSKGTSESGPITPLDADEHFIDRLWERVRSGASGHADEKEQIRGGNNPASGGQSLPRLTRRRSITYRESSDGKNIVVMLDLPDVNKSDVHISFQHQRLVVSYKTLKEIERRDLDKIVQETRERRYVRTIPLPDGTRSPQIEIILLQQPMSDDTSTELSPELSHAAHLVRITSGGKIKLWVDFSLKFFKRHPKENPGRPLTFHTLPISPLANVSASTPPVTSHEHVQDESAEAEAASQSGLKKRNKPSPSASNIPRLISVIEIIKREYLKTKVPGHGHDRTGLFQYNSLGTLGGSESPVDSIWESLDEEHRQRRITAALEGRNFHWQERTPYMQVTLCTSSLLSMEDKHTVQPPLTRGPDIGHLAKWSVSSYKFGFGPECLRDDDPETFWQLLGRPSASFYHYSIPKENSSTGYHSWLIRFLSVGSDCDRNHQKVSLHLSFPLDDSYTPSTLCLRAGTSLSDLQDIRVVTLDKPNGWISFDVSAELNEEGQEFKPVYCYVLQIIVLSNHMNGKDTHVRGLHILGPMEEASHEDDPFPFVTPQFKMYECIR
ncbi:hypothetical protein EW145_g931 [Phellinidium pouzarii]|uniref:DOC domain-containing protein n=1 Tax=Phellinidium pouzarii TaxID=167371 RepID=A0A4V3XDT7_9AGAM|nr:hypothetical protein EW145_g931 [Phellinidium pouzarii]